MKTTDHKKELKKAFEGIKIVALANALSRSIGGIYNIKYAHRRASAWLAIEIEKQSEKLGHKIPREILRPDIFGN